MSASPLAALRGLILVLESLEIRYAIGGSVASSAWGEPRSTHDTDLLAAIEAEQVPELVRRLSSDYYLDAGLVRDGVLARRSFSLLHLASYHKLDVFVAGEGVLDREQLARSLPRRLAGDDEHSYSLTSPEVLVVRKLDWFRRGDEVSERQWRDVLSILRAQRGELDEDFLADLARRTDLEDLLSRALRESGDRA